MGIFPLLKPYFYPIYFYYACDFGTRNLRFWYKLTCDFGTERAILVQKKRAILVHKNQKALSVRPWMFDA